MRKYLIRSLLLAPFLLLGSFGLSPLSLAGTQSYDFADSSDYVLSNQETIEIDDGVVRLVPTADVGDGSDGDLTVSGTVNLADAGYAPTWFVSSLSTSGGKTTARVTDPASTQALALGDEVLLVQIQGYIGQTGNVGNHEFFTVSALSADTVVFDRLKELYYGDGESDGNIGTGSSKHRVMLMRVPHFNDVTLADGATLTTQSWTGTKGGVLAMRIAGSLTLNGNIRMDGAGYKGGPDNSTKNSTGYQGDSIAGAGTRSRQPNIGGGGGGGLDGSSCSNCQVGGAGASYGTSGVAGSPDYGGSSLPGNVYGFADLRQLYLGSGGGAGADDSESGVSGGGGAGGGIIFIAARVVTGSGQISARGANGITGRCAGASDGPEVSSGGGGSGGSLYITAVTMNLFAQQLLATGGAGAPGVNCSDGTGANGGNGGAGRIRVDYKTINGKEAGTTSAESALNAAADPDPGSLNALDGLFVDSAPYVTTIDPVAPTPFLRWTGFTATPTSRSTGTFRFQLSPDQGSSWIYWNGSSWTSAGDTSTEYANTAIDVDAHIGAIDAGTLNVRAFLVSDTLTFPELDDITIFYDLDENQVDDDGDGYTEKEGDCDDTKSNVYPGAAEDPLQTGYGDNLDNDCDGDIDNGTRRFDDDGDGQSEVQGDCDDDDSSIYSGAAEVCDDTIDQNCDGRDTQCSQADQDKDGYSPVNGDCDDTDPAINPGALEVCDDGIDQDCKDGDEICSDVDHDGDSFTPDQGDCDDTNPDIRPYATETCNDGIDQDCSGHDLDCRDDDGDSDGYTENEGDCNDEDSAVSPDGLEVCDDSIDQDCSGKDLDCRDVDGDGDDFTPRQGDCDDHDVTVFPSAGEDPLGEGNGDGKDNDCDGVIDEGTHAADNDGDGYCVGNTSGACTDGSDPNDCNDHDDEVFPGAPEDPDFTGYGDNKDNDCDGDTDEGTRRFDDDGDGLNEIDGDCDDADGAIYPGATETCDGVDENCDGQVDEGFDQDRDGHQDASLCGEGADDCNDSQSSVYTGAIEICDGLDNDCDDGQPEGGVDEDFEDLDENGVADCLEQDHDQDGFLPGDGDCNDADPAIHPQATEVCDGLDNNCDGLNDEGFDLDKDGYLDADQCASVEGAGPLDCNDTNSSVHPDAVEICEDGVDQDCDGSDASCDDRDGDGYSTAMGDCDDADANVFPGATEDPAATGYGDGIDNNCNGSVDEGTLRVDDDGDGESEADGDCDDADPDVYSAADEVCDNADNNCDGASDEGFDLDQDGYLAQDACASIGGDDCDDADPRVHPGADEDPGGTGYGDGFDNDCDGQTDEGTLVSDDDGDGQSEVDGDCDDADATTYQGAVELEDGVDNDCDGTIDDPGGDTSPTPWASPTPAGEEPGGCTCRSSRPVPMSGSGLPGIALWLGIVLAGLGWKKRDV